MASLSSWSLTDPIIAEPTFLIGRTSANRTFSCAFWTIDGRHMLLNVVQWDTKTRWGIPWWGLGNFEVFNTHPTPFVTLPIHSPSLSLLLLDLSYWSEILVARIELIFWIVGQHLTRQFEPKFLKGLPILLLDEPLRIKPPLATFDIHIIRRDHGNWKSVQYGCMSVFPRGVSNLGIFYHIVDIVNTIIMPKVGWPGLVLFNPPKSPVWPLTSPLNWHVQVTDGILFMLQMLVAPVDWNDTNVLVYGLVVLSPPAFSLACTCLIATIGFSNRIAFGRGSPALTTSWWRYSFSPSGKRSHRHVCVIPNPLLPA